MVGKIKCYCNGCKKITNHEILADIDDLNAYDCDYECRVHFQIVKCMGCDNYEFRRLFIDLENGHYVDPDENDFEPKESDNIYPKIIVVHFSEQQRSCLPESIRSLYDEVNAAISSECYLLAGIGLRMLIESMCNDLDVSGRDLATKITDMLSKGFISNDSCTMLHQIRFLGNDATHDQEKPSLSSIEIALSVIENVLLLHYIQPEKAKRKLPPALKYEDFKSNILSNSNKFHSGEEGGICHFLKLGPEKWIDKKTFMKKFLDEVKSGTVSQFSPVPQTPMPTIEKEKIKKV